MTKKKDWVGNSEYPSRCRRSIALLYCKLQFRTGLQRPSSTCYVCVVLHLFDGCPNLIPQNCDSPPVVSEQSCKQQTTSLCATGIMMLQVVCIVNFDYLDADYPKAPRSKQHVANSKAIGLKTQIIQDQNSYKVTISIKFMLWFASSDWVTLMAS